ncbi:hypothetical protein [Mycolicibacterium mageritense]|uniref:hypothetical protein n=1 Tax=Mycolicibacterium mageritense TaxID=53462 RepID=UPI0011D48930|nr:hypothetical protein [Mycolicibacterium mageritense]TXI62208.1 MAG: hypothetical protein E6Q55_13655 [Mycolicibacterium mageritense]
MSGEVENARRTIDKAADVLAQCEAFFRHQAQMNAAAHLSANVMYPPIYSAVQSVQQGIVSFRNAYPSQSTCKHCDLSIENRGSSWTHTEGPQSGLHRCAVEPYGYDAAPVGEPCSHACLGSSTGIEGRVPE